MVITAALRHRASYYIFVLWFLLSSFFPRLFSAIADYTHDTGRKKSPKIRHLDTIAQLCRAVSSRSCYIKCAKIFLGFTKYYSVTNMLLLTGLPSFDTLMNNARITDAARWSVCSNAFVKSLLIV